MNGKKIQLINEVNAMNFQKLVNKRVVLTCKNNLSYAGVVKGLLIPFEDIEYVAVELDEKSGFAIMSPLNFVEKVIEIPINKDVS